MSMIGNNLLNQIIIEKGITEPAEILNALNMGVQSSLKQGSNEIETSDGMDVAICSIDVSAREVQFAGAFRPLVIVREGVMEKINGNKFPIGGKQIDNERNFKSHTRILNPGDTIYMFSDGYADQFGGEKGKKFMVKRMDELILGMQHLDMEEQERLMDERLEQWRGDYQQVDDILVIGIRF
jgi:serine phosphatase RsbU (regulator of sigma subunit)